MFPNRTNMTYLMPSLRWVWIYSFWILNVKRALNLSSLFYFEILLPVPYNLQFKKQYRNRDSKFDIRDDRDMSGPAMPQILQLWKWKSWKVSKFVHRMLHLEFIFRSGETTFQLEKVVGFLIIHFSYGQIGLRIFS